MTRGQPSFTAYDAARHRLSAFQKAVGAGLVVLFLCLLALDWILAIRALIVVNLAYGAGFLILRAAAVVTAMMAPPQERPSAKTVSDLPTISLLCPLYKEPDSLPNLVGALERLDYPPEKREILLLLESDDLETRQAAKALDGDFRMVIIPPGTPRTKPRALNVALLEARGDIIGIYDAEDRPEADQLRKVAGALADGSLAGVQARLNYYNRHDGAITRGIMAQTPQEFLAA